MILLGLSMYPYLKIFGFVTALQFNIFNNFLIVDG